MAIAFDATAPAGTVATSPLTWSHVTGAGSNRLLLVGVAIGSGTQSTVTGVTYNGVALTKMTSQQAQNAGFGATDEVSIWALVNPPVGTFTVSVAATLGTNPDFAGCSVSLTGAKQTTTPDATSSATNTSITQGAQNFNHTTVGNNAWVFAIGNYMNNGASQATLAAIQTSRTVQPMSINLNGEMAMEDTNGPKTPAGVQSMGFTTGGGTGLASALFNAVSVSVAPQFPAGERIVMQAVNRAGSY